MTRRILLSLIYGNPDQPRKTFEPGALAELAESITQNGLKQPITVRPDGSGRYMIVMGERRFRATSLTDAIDIECQISEADDTQLAIDAIIENDQRVDVAPLEQAESYQRMIDQFGFDPETLAKKLGKPLRRITERLQLLSLSDTSRILLKSGGITPTQAWWVAQVPQRLQNAFIRGISSGGIVTNDQLKAFAATLTAEDSQDALFAMDEAPPPEIVRAARTFEKRIQDVAAMLRASIDDNQVSAVRRVDPGRAGTIADLCAAMRTDLARIETAFRVAAGMAGASE